MNGKRHSWLSAVVALMGAIGCGGKALQIVGESNQAGATSDPSPGGKGGGTSDVFAGSAGVGGLGAELPGDVVAHALSLVTDIAADDTTLYWVEHGSEDELGNYLNDGRLMARDLVSGEERVIADDLPGPAGLGVTDSHAFVYLDHAYQGGGGAALARIPLSGGSYERMLSGVPAYKHSFVHEGDTAYFAFDGRIYRARPEDEAASPFATLDVISLTVADGAIYSNAHTGFWRVPLDTAEPELVSTEHLDFVQVAGDFAYWLEFENPPLYLMRTPISGDGQSIKLPPGHRAGGKASQLMLQEGLFFHDVYLYRDGRKNDAWGVVQGRLDDPASAQYALELPVNPDVAVGPWVGTAFGIYYVDMMTIRHVQNPVK
jgi:hypothetical protein